MCITENSITVHFFAEFSSHFLLWEFSKDSSIDKYFIIHAKLSRVVRYCNPITKDIKILEVNLERIQRFLKIKISGKRQKR